MRCKLRELASILVAISALTSTSDAAVTVSSPDSFGRIYLDISGEIQDSDYETFKTQVESNPDSKRAVVRLQSIGGAAYASLEIGKLIYRRKLSTYVPKGALCASGCALIWLAGTPRIADLADSRIGFHHAFNRKDGRPGGQINALLGAYLKNLGLNDDAISWMTEKGSEDLNYLTPETAQQYHIDYYPPSSLPEPSPGPTYPSQPNTETFWTTAELHLRAAPNSTAADVLPWLAPDDQMPKGAEVRVNTNRCLSRNGLQDPTEVWCPVVYGSYSGYSSAYYLANAKGQRLACILYPTAQGCTTR
jgi:hypothetical protein